MSAGSIKTKRLRQPENIERGAAAREAVLFILPSILVTASTIMLFTFLTGFTPEQHNRFVVTIFLAIIPSLLGAAGFQVLVYRAIDENRAAPARAAARAIFAGLIFAVIFSAVVAGLVLAFIGPLGLTMTDFSYFAVLLVLFSMVWIIMAAFWAARQFYYPVVLFGIGYLLILALTYGFHRLDTAYTIAGYTLGVLLLFLMSAVAALKALGRARREEAAPRVSLASLAGRSTPLIIFSILYLLAIFLDKIIVWVYQGAQGGTGLLIPGPYTTGAFLGLVPTFSVAATFYFGRAAGKLVEKRYEGTLAEIRQRARAYLKIYRHSLWGVVALWAGLFALVNGLVYIFLPDPEVLRVAVTVGIGSLFLVLILHNSQFLVTFGKGGLSALAMSIVIAGELASIPFVHLDFWYAAAGFLAGTMLGFILSEIYTWTISGEFEFQIYRYATRFAGFKWE